MSSNKKPPFPSHKMPPCPSLIGCCLWQAGHLVYIYAHIWLFWSTKDVDNSSYSYGFLHGIIVDPYYDSLDLSLECYNLIFFKKRGEMDLRGHCIPLVKKTKEKQWEIGRGKHTLPHPIALSPLFLPHLPAAIPARSTAPSLLFLSCLPLLLPLMWLEACAGDELRRLWQCVHRRDIRRLRLPEASLLQAHCAFLVPHSSPSSHSSHIQSQCRWLCSCAGDALDGGVRSNL